MPAARANLTFCCREVETAYGIATGDLAYANNLSLKRRLSIGMDLIIPIDPRAAAAHARPAALAPPATSTAAADLPAAGSKPRISYKVKPGDTLAGIASQFRTTIQALQSWNGIRGTRIVAGDSLTIYTN